MFGSRCRGTGPFEARALRLKLRDACVAFDQHMPGFDDARNKVRPFNQAARTSFTPAYGQQPFSGLPPARGGADRFPDRGTGSRADRDADRGNPPAERGDRGERGTPDRGDRDRVQERERPPLGPRNDEYEFPPFIRRLRDGNR